MKNSIGRGVLMTIALVVVGCGAAEPSASQGSPSPAPSAAASQLDVSSPDVPLATDEASPSLTNISTPDATSEPTQDEATEAPATPRPTLPPGLTAPKVEVAIPCGTGDVGNVTFVDGDTIYVDCPDYGDKGAILVIDATSGKVVRKLMLARFSIPVAFDHGIWIEKHEGACIDGACTTPWVERLNATTGKVELHLDGQFFAAATVGYVWLKTSAGSLTRIDAATLERTPAASVTGSGFSGPCAAAKPDPSVSGLAETRGQCWAVVKDETQKRSRFVRLGAGGIEYQGAWIGSPEDSKPVAPELMVRGDGFWMAARHTDDYDSIVQVDPTTGQALGTRWGIGNTDWLQLFAAGGKVWLFEEENDSRLVRLNVGSQALWSGSAS